MRPPSPRERLAMFGVGMLIGRVLIWFLEYVDAVRHDLTLENYANEYINRVAATLPPDQVIRIGPNTPPKPFYGHPN